jgi:hypothetical protein
MKQMTHDNSHDQVRFEIDPEDGLRIALVPVDRAGNVAVVEEDDYRALLDAGLSPTWFTNASVSGYRYVKTSLLGVRGGNISPARMILNLGPGQQVRYRDKDRLNLRRSNIGAVAGRAGRMDRDVVRNAVEWRKERGLGAPVARPRRPKKAQGLAPSRAALAA